MVKYLEAEAVKRAVVDAVDSGLVTTSDDLEELIDDLPAADVELETQDKSPAGLPCKIGDVVWAIRDFKGHKHPQQGIVSEMYYVKGMELHIVVRHVARGCWGEKVFATLQDAEAAVAAIRPGV